MVETVDGMNFMICDEIFFFFFLECGTGCGLEESFRNCGRAISAAESNGLL